MELYWLFFLGCAESHLVADIDKSLLRSKTKITLKTTEMETIYDLGTKMIEAIS